MRPALLSTRRRVPARAPFNHRFFGVAPVPYWYTAPTTGVKYHRGVPEGPVRRRLSKDARRAELLRAGEEVFSARPFDDVSIDDIAAAAGISKNLLYHYFAGKRELFLAVISEAADRMLAMTEPDEQLEPMDRLRASLDAHLTYAVEHAQGYAALLRGAGGDAEVQAVVAAAHDRVADRVIGSLPLPEPASPELQLTVRGWVGLVDSLTLHWIEHRQLPQERVRDLLAELFVALITAGASVRAR